MYKCVDFDLGAGACGEAWTVRVRRANRPRELQARFWECSENGRAFSWCGARAAILNECNRLVSSIEKAAVAQR